MEPPFPSVCIVAPGLLGGSLAAALVRQGVSVSVWARREAPALGLLERGWATRWHSDLREAVRGCALVVVAAPVDVIPPLVEAVMAGADPGTLITDVGSTKGQICARFPGAAPDGVRFLGAHPMAGSEKSGWEHADPDLFQGRWCWITPGPESRASDLEALRAFWASLGMVVGVLPPGQHDQIVAQNSHLPHMLASALAAWLEQQPGDPGRFGGQGLRDTTRIAAGDPALWVSIARHNRAALLEALSAFAGQLDALRAQLEREDWEALAATLAAGKRWRDRLDLEGKNAHG